MFQRIPYYWNAWWYNVNCYWSIFIDHNNKAIWIDNHMHKIDSSDIYPFLKKIIQLKLLDNPGLSMIWNTRLLNGLSG